MTQIPEELPAPAGLAEPRSTRRLDLPARLDLNAADELAEALEHLRESSLELEASKVTQLSALCLQVLVSAHRQWRQDGSPFRIIAPSAAFVNGLTLLGVPAAYFEQDPAT